MNPIFNVWEYQTKKSIYDWGRPVKVVYGSTANCSSCAYDPIAKEATNSFCSTCSGKFYFQTENTKWVKGVIKQLFLTFGDTNYVMSKFGYAPDHDARLTCWLPDVLVKTDSATGTSYLDSEKNIRVECEGKKYSITSTDRIGIERPKIIISTLKETK